MRQPFTLAILLSTLALTLAPTPPAAQMVAEVAYTWTAPTTGSPAASYVVEHSVEGGAYVRVATTTTESYTLAAVFGESHQVRVAAVDGQGRQGPFSQPSEPYTPELGLPGTPGQPIPVF